MPEFIIKDVPVIFPFEPYSVQRAYMERVIECLDNSGNAVLESPTGLCNFFLQNPFSCQEAKLMSTNLPTC